MPLILFLRVCSFWRAVNLEMVNATLELLDKMEHGRGRRVRSDGSTFYSRQEHSDIQRELSNKCGDLGSGYQYTIVPADDELLYAVSPGISRKPGQ